ncbi:MAG: patatin-like phospholipase family protein [Magnetospirillum sp.]|nr:patatin-like phospholipase family protein [Magnetospirillum sp.]
MGRRKRIALALQGGGTHGAFAWGVLDALLEEVGKGTIELVAVGGASTGAFNATALAYGLHEGAARPGPATAAGRRMADGARAKLGELWEAVARTAFWGANPLVAAIGLIPGWNIDDTPAARWADVAAGTSTPQDSGISNHLSAVVREVLPEIPAILALPGPGLPRLVVAATDVGECRRQLFIDGAVSPDALRASAVVPASLRPVEIGGRHYWDGGFMGNPPLTPLVECLREADAEDLVVVTSSPLHRDGVPRTPHQVMDRLTELTFNAGLIHEVNAIETINRMIDAGMIKDPPPGQHPFRRVNLHRIHDDAAMAELGIYSKEAPAWDFLAHLRDLGRAAFQRSWPGIEGALGRESSWDTKALCDQVLSRAAIARGTAVA